MTSLLLGLSDEETCRSTHLQLTQSCRRCTRLPAGVLMLSVQALSDWLDFKAGGCYGESRVCSGLRLFHSRWFDLFIAASVCFHRLSQVIKSKMFTHEFTLVEPVNVLNLFSLCDEGCCVLFFVLSQSEQSALCGV